LFNFFPPHTLCGLRQSCCRRRASPVAIPQALPSIAKEVGYGAKPRYKKENINLFLTKNICLGI
ncbi:hypothetical protein, partial [Brachyspira hyodysenteriae]|uniref:hypothetical protein n=2 Tax=Brachyspira hyodysenteriae TaxID=159 RepID=UPI0019553245